jgi:hypothetical protein
MYCRVALQVASCEQSYYVESLAVQILAFHFSTALSLAARSLEQISADVRLPADGCATAFERRHCCAHRAAGL